MNYLENLRLRKLDRYRYAMYGTLSTHLSSDFALSEFFLQHSPNGRRYNIKTEFGLQIHAFHTWVDDVSGTDEALNVLALEVHAIEPILSKFALYSVENASNWFEKYIRVNATRGTLLLNTTSDRVLGANGLTFKKRRETLFFPYCKKKTFRAREIRSKYYLVFLWLLFFFFYVAKRALLDFLFIDEIRAYSVSLA